MKYFCLSVLFLFLSCSSSSKPQITSSTDQINESSNQNSELSSDLIEEISYSEIFIEKDSSFIKNPGKGWVLYGLPRNHTMASLQYGSLGYERFNWMDIEPNEGEYNWELIDNFINSWAQHSMKSAFGVMTGNMHSFTEYVTPKWVFDAGCQERRVTYDNPEYAIDVAQTQGYEGEQVIPQDWSDSVFMEKLSNLLTAIAERYDGDPNIAWYEIRSYGNWGEGHLYPWGGLELTPNELYESHIQLHLDIFTQTPLMAAETYLRNSQIRSLAIENGVGIRDDGVVTYRNGSTTKPCEGLVQSAFEWGGTYEQFSNDGILYRLEQNIVRGRVYYCGFARYGDSDIASFAQNEVDLIERVGNLLGYHLVIESVLLPNSFLPQNQYNIEITWNNHGVARMWFDAHFKFALLNENHEVVFEYLVEDFNLREVESDIELTAQFQVELAEDFIDTLKYAAVGVFSNETQDFPNIKLGNIGSTENGWYILKQF